MSRSSGFASHRFLLVGVASLLLGLSLAPAAATASTLPSGCTELTAKIATANADPNHGEGDVIVLNGMCNGANLKMSGGVSIPAEANFAIEGAGGTVSGFDGTGVTAPLLHSAGFEGVGSVVLRNLTFQHADVSANGAALSLRASHLTLADDSFLENTTHGQLGGAVFVFIEPPTKPLTCADAPSSPPGVTITGSTFRANKLLGPSSAGGGALWFAQVCTNPSELLEGNVFEGNTVEVSAAGGEAEGGALFFESDSSEAPTPVAQRGNVFDSNKVVATSTTSDYGGGGEWLEGASLTSVGDRFSRNALPGTASPKWSWGGGLGILNTGCNTVTPTESTLENAVVVGNSIAAGTPSALGGAGLYVGCSPSPTNPNHLNLLDSTVTANVVGAGGVAGVDGNPGDQLRLVNSIVSGDTGAEIGGFSGSLSASFSDVCAAGGASPLPGEGNICTNPLLANNGNPSSFDVHEMSASPTIDAGSNALVPNGLTTDAFGTTRILAGHTGCIGSFPAVVDMGAAEFQSAAPSCLPPRSPARGLTHFVSLRTTSKGAALRLSCTSTDGLGCSGEIFLTTDETRQGKKVIAVGASKRTKRTKRTTVSVRIGQAPFSLPAGGTATFQVKLNSTGLQLLRRFHTISAWVLANETMTNSSPVIFLLHSTLFSQPKHKHKSKHKSRHAKRRH